MPHIKPLSRTPEIGQLDGTESLILFIFTIFFNGFDNFRSVLTNLQKFFSKTP